MGRQRKFTPWLAGITALVALAILLFPVYAVIVGSFENNAQLLGTHYNFFPPTPTLANYRNVISTQGSHIVSSLIIGIATAILTLVIALPAAYALARYRFRVTVVVVASLLVAQILPSIVIANSLFVVYHKLHLLNGSTLQPITLSIYNYIGVFSSNLGAAMALVVFAILPAAMMLIAAQRYIAAGLTVGSVKG